MGLIRWKAVLPATLLVSLLVGGWTLFADALLRRMIERQGSAALCAKVELDAFSISLRRLTVRLAGLRVTDADAPMTNLVEVAQAGADLSWDPLLEKKVNITNLTATGVAFGTRRATSGALGPCPDRPPGIVAQILADWIAALPRPSLDLGGLERIRRLPELRPDSLATVRQARAIVALGDSLKGAVEADLRAADPRPTIDSARALVARLAAVAPRALDVAGGRALVGDTRRTIADVQAAKRRLADLRGSTERRLDSLVRGVRALDDARRADLAWARSLIQLPSLELEDVSAALFTDLAVARLRPLLYYANLAEQYVPPGLDPRKKPGPRRARLAGTTYAFPREETYPSLLLSKADVSFALGGGDPTAGRYAATITDATTEPGVLGRPLRLVASREGAAVGPRDLRVRALLDRRTLRVIDSLDVLASGLELPTLTLAPIGASLALGPASSQLTIERRGAGLAGRWRLNASGLRWARLGAPDTVALDRIGSSAWTEALAWRAVSAIRDLSLDVTITGSLERPVLAIRSNVGDQLARGLRAALGDEIDRVERQLRAEVDRVVQAQVAEARARLTVLDDAKARLAAHGVELDDLERALEGEVQRLSGGLAPGVSLPRLPGVR